MRLTEFTDYALRLLLHLGAHPGEAVTTGQVARACSISPSHLSKIVHRLGQGGVLRTSRGRKGGIALARPPAQIMLGSLIRMTEPDFTMVGCFADSGHDNCVLEPHCQLRRVLASATSAFLARLDGVPLSALLAAPMPLLATAACQAPPFLSSTQ